MTTFNAGDKVTTTQEFDVVYVFPKYYDEFDKLHQDVQLQDAQGARFRADIDTLTKVEPPFVPEVGDVLTPETALKYPEGSLAAAGAWVLSFVRGGWTNHATGDLVAATWLKEDFTVLRVGDGS